MTKPWIGPTNKRTLPVKLDDNARLAVARQAARHVHERDEEQAALKAYQKTAKSKIGELDEKIAKLTEVVRTGYEGRPVDCHEEHIEREGGGIVRVIRDDTGELVLERSMKPEEEKAALRRRQKEFGFDDAPANVRKLPKK